MKKLTFGTAEEFVPSRFCKGFSYKETPIKYNTEKIDFTLTPHGCRLEFPLTENEQIYGFGLQLKEFNHRGRRLRLKVNSDPLAPTGDSHAPVPFFVTTECYGVYIDTARCIEVNCGLQKKRFRREDANASSEVKLSTQELYANIKSTDNSTIVVDIPAAKGVDIYIFEGETITDVVAQYNLLSGGGCDVPEWGLGVLYRAFGRSTENDIKGLVEYFEKNEIPCDTIGFEPGWQSAAYSCTYIWNSDNFPNYKETVEFLKNKGYHINLWEHAYVNPASPIYEPLYDLSGDYEVWKGLVPDFSLPETRKIFADYHKENFVDIGIDGFKLDECDGSDFCTGDWCFPSCAKFPSGMDGEQYHNLFGTLYMQTITEALGDKKTLSEVRSAGALSASYPFVLYSDLYDLPDFIRGVVNSGFAGILWTPEVRDAKSKNEFIRRLQANVFSCQCIINAWYCEEVPWKYLDCENEVRKLLNVRKSLIPSLKEAFDKYRDTGVAPVRALVSDYTNDKNTYEIDDEYIFCDNLIVCPMTLDSDEREVYLPDGDWYDFWTKEKVRPGKFTVKSKNIPVFIKNKTATD